MKGWSSACETACQHLLNELRSIIDSQPSKEVIEGAARKHLSSLSPKARKRIDIELSRRIKAGALLSESKKINLEPVFNSEDGFSRVAEKVASEILKLPGIKTDPLSEVKAQELVKAALDPLTLEGRNRVIREVTRILEGKQAEKVAQIGNLKERQAAFQQISDWLDALVTNGPVLEPNQASRLHKIHELGIEGALIEGRTTERFDGDKLKSWKHTFVVKHNWASAFEKADGLDGDDIRLPFELCTFEFRINGRSVTALAWDHELGVQKYNQRIGFSLLVEANGKWYDYGGVSPNEKEHDPLFAFCWQQIRAICIALEAEVAVHEVVRAPVALNQKRARTGKPPLRDHYVIDLARRHRVANPSTPKDDDDKRRVRLHFRRGHWRHYETSKTWIKWMLVGNPDLGFIQKRYSL